MSDIKYNNSLEKVIEFAKSRLKGDNASLTAERFIISVMLAVFEDDYAFGQDEKQTLHLALIEHFPFESVGYESIKDYFFEKLEKESYLDSLYMQQRIIESQEFAKKKGMEQLTTYVLLMSIFERPNEYIEKCMKGQRTADENAAMAGVNSEIQNGSFAWEFDHARSNDGTDTAAGSEPVDPKGVIVKLTEKVKNIYDRLVQAVFGQDNAVNVFTTGYFQSELIAMTDKNRTRPRATFLFAGPPGVGKTFLAEKAAEVLGLPFKRFDMSEYSDKEANLEFCGMDSAYQNAKEGNVTSFVAKNPKCILLFDEIEKAHINVIHLFLQLLDAGRLRDNKTDKEVSFSDAIIIFTTNAGKQIYEDSDAVDFSGLSRKVILKALQKDVNARTGVPFFPAAICSRFASGNVVMFNHISAHNLREIAKREVQRHANNFEKEFGIKVNIDERVYTSLLFAEGGAADARAIRSRAETFFDDELFELFRLLDSDSVDGKIEELDSINIKVELPCNNKEIYNLFERDDMHEALVFSSKQVCDLCVDKSSKVRFVGAQDVETAKNLINNHDISFALVDLSYGISLDGKYLNIEDVDSKSRDFLGFVKKYHAEIPVYLLQSSEKELNTEEQISFMRQGIRGIITLSGTAEKFDSEICNVTEMLHQQKSIMNLAKANKAVTFETAQSVCNDGKTAEIELFDFKLSVAIDAEDSKSILSNVSKPNVRFEQVIGAEDAKKELKYFVEYLKNPKKYAGTGVSAPKGVILYGPPGTGKTMLAKAMASESDVTFIAAEGNQFLKKYVGEGSEKVHELFLTARKY
ncbi:MAG: AAA family ATPase, partial [Acutalibacteraceae bacterium]